MYFAIIVLNLRLFNFPVHRIYDQERTKHNIFNQTNPIKNDNTNQRISIPIPSIGKQWACTRIHSSSPGHGASTCDHGNYWS
jgi:hypothetical protein